MAAEGYQKIWDTLQTSNATDETHQTCIAELLGSFLVGEFEGFHVEGKYQTSTLVNLVSRTKRQHYTMDEYPAGSLDHSVPFLLTLGTSGDPTYQSGLSAVLKEQAILIRSELPPLDSDQAHALLRYIQNRDASNLPCNGLDAPKKHRFHVKTAERVGGRFRANVYLVQDRDLMFMCIPSQYSYRLAARASQMASTCPHRLLYYTLPTLP